MEEGGRSRSISRLLSSRVASLVKLDVKLEHFQEIWVELLVSARLGRYQ
jgi:hypothetical protein